MLARRANTGSALRLYRLTQDWIEDEATWNERSIGLAWGSAGADGSGSNAGVSLAGDCTATGPPVPVSPVNGSTGVPTSPALTAFVSDPGGGSLTASVALRRAAGPEFTIVVLPDTQHYSEAFPAIFTSQTQWIVDSKDARNIVFVTHEGDVVEHYNVIAEYQTADAERIDSVDQACRPGSLHAV